MRVRSNSRGRRSAAIALGVVLAMILTACGSDDEAIPPTQPSTTTTTTTIVVAPELGLLRYGHDGIVLVGEHSETRIVDGPVGWAASDRAGGVVFTRAGGGDDWSRRGVTTWWLPVDATDPLLLPIGGLPDIDPEGSPVMVGRPASSGMACDAEQSPVVRHDLATGEETLVSCRDEMGDAWFWITSAGGGRTALSEGYDVLNISAIGSVTILDSQGHALGLPGNPYGNGCPETAEPWRCDAHGLLSPDGLLIATWYRPDHVMTVDWNDAPPEWTDVHSQWLDRLDSVTATIRVLELDTGRELFAAQTPARTRLADFDGRWLAVAPRRFDDDQHWVDVRDAPWRVIDTTGTDPPLLVDGPVALVP